MQYIRNAPKIYRGSRQHPPNTIVVTPNTLKQKQSNRNVLQSNNNRSNVQANHMEQILTQEEKYEYREFEHDCVLKDLLTVTKRKKNKTGKPRMQKLKEQPILLTRTSMNNNIELNEQIIAGVKLFCEKNQCSSKHEPRLKTWKGNSSGNL